MVGFQTIMQVAGLLVILGALVFVLIERRRNKSIAQFKARRRSRWTGPCPVSDEHKTSTFSSYQDIWCHDCRQFRPWPLKDSEPPLLGPARDKRSSK